MNDDKSHQANNRMISSAFANPEMSDAEKDNLAGDAMRKLDQDRKADHSPAT